jgi:ribosomal protein S18 acetylase RimI-like enzyme
MHAEIRREDSRLLSAYASIPIGFDIREVVDVANARVGGATVPTWALEDVRTKDYDAILGNDPLSWAARFNVDSWIVLAAYDGTARVGGAIVIADPLELAKLGESVNVAVLWDLRVAPAQRRCGIGRALVGAAEVHAHGAGCRRIDAETQDTNVPACRLYARCGFVLESVVRHAYPDVPTEAKMVWTKQFAESRAPSPRPSLIP